MVQFKEANQTLSAQAEQSAQQTWLPGGCQARSTLLRDPLLTREGTGTICFIKRSARQSASVCLYCRAEIGLEPRIHLQDGHSPERWARIIEEWRAVGATQEERGQQRHLGRRQPLDLATGDIAGQDEPVRNLSLIHI